MALVKKRYPFLTIFWIVLALNIGFSFLGVLSVLIIGSPHAMSSLMDMATLDNFVRFIVGVFSQALFFFYSLNYYNSLMVGKMNAIYYLRYSVFIAVVAVGYLLLVNYLLPEEITIVGKK